MRYYILDKNGRVTTIDNQLEWSACIEDIDRCRVAKDIIGDYRVSTVFLGLNHGWESDGPPILWETMVFRDQPDDWEDLEQDRCSGNREQAEAMHALMVEKVKTWETWK